MIVNMAYSRFKDYKFVFVFTLFCVYRRAVSVLLYFHWHSASVASRETKVKRHFFSSD